MEKMSIMMKIYVQSNPRFNTTGLLILGLSIVLCLAHRSISPRYIVDCLAHRPINPRFIVDCLAHWPIYPWSIVYHCRSIFLNLRCTPTFTDEIFSRPISASFTDKIWDFFRDGYI